MRNDGMRKREKKTNSINILTVVDVIVGDNFSFGCWRENIAIAIAIAIVIDIMISNNTEAIPALQKWNSMKDVGGVCVLVKTEKKGTTEDWHSLQSNKTEFIPTKTQ